jgi:acetyl-CoA acyltransferase
VRRDTSLEKLAALPPVFDRRYGTVTAGNSSPLTDGAAAVLLMSEERAKAEGYAPLAFIRSWAVSAVDPGGQLLMGPGFAIPKALERAGLSLAAMDLIEIGAARRAGGSRHPGARVPVLGPAEVGPSPRWGGRPDRLNVRPGRSPWGTHPAPPGRMTTTLPMSLRAAGFGCSVYARRMGFAMVLER